MKRYATRLRVRLSMLTAMLAFSVGARLPNSVTNSAPPVDAVMGSSGSSWRAAAQRRLSGTGFGDQRLRPVHRGEFNRREALRTFGRRGSDGHAAMSEGAEALARDEGANGRRAGGLQLQRPAAGRAQA